MKLVVWKNHLGVKFCTEVVTMTPDFFGVRVNTKFVVLKHYYFSQIITFLVRAITTEPHIAPKRTMQMWSNFIDMTQCFLNFATTRGIKPFCNKQIQFRSSSEETLPIEPRLTDKHRLDMMIAMLVVRTGTSTFVDPSCPTPKRLPMWFLNHQR